MAAVSPQYVVDSHGKRRAVIVSLRDYRRMVEALEMADDVRLYDEAKAADETPIPWDEAMRGIDGDGS